MKERAYGIVFGILNIVLLVICAFFFQGKDKAAPEIILSESDFVYAAQDGEDVLFQGVTAFDKEDGELTELVVIEKIVTDEEKETATITYGVVDKAGNVGKATRTVSMYVEEDLSDENLAGNTESHEESEVEDGVVADSDRIGAEPEEAGTLEDGTEDEESEDGGEENADRESEEDGLEEESESSEGEKPEEESEGEALPTAGEAGNVGQNAGPEQNSGRPAIVFRSQEVKTKAGQSPAWVNVIEGLHDDIDNYETLLKSLKVNGDYDKDKAGTYDVTVTVTDGDGNESNAYPMKIVVEAWE